MPFRRAVLIVGSPRPKSTSESLGTYLMTRLKGAGIDGSTIVAHEAVRSENATAEMDQAVEQADLVIFSFPLYVDSPPFSMVRVIEHLGTIRESRIKRRKKPMLMAISNCGSSDAHQNDIAIDICKIFAQRTGFVWAGGMSLAMGGLVNGASLGELGGQVEFVRGALDLAAQSLIQGKRISEKAKAMMSKPLMPIFPQAETGPEKRR